MLVSIAQSNSFNRKSVLMYLYEYTNTQFLFLLLFVGITEATLCY